MEETTKSKLYQAVVFAILMENGNGILEKAPSYIMEKLDSCFDPHPEALLDVNNLAKFNQWKIRWEATRRE